MIEDTKTKAVAYYNALNKKNIDAVKELLHPDVQFSDPQETVIGREAVLNAAKGFAAIFNTLTIREKFGSEKYLIQLSGKSSLARIGLIVHNTAGLINPGHYLNITFELANMNSVPIILRPGMDIAQLLFAQMSSAPE